MAMDYFTKWPEAYALVDGMFSHVKFGVAESKNSDQGRNFESRVFLLGIHITTGFNRMLAEQLSIVLSEIGIRNCHLT